MRRVLFVAVAFAGILLLPKSVHAQATIAGVIRDASAAVLPGVTVEASSPVLIEKTRTVVSDGAGQYRITDLKPGTYSVTFALTGFATVKREDVVVSVAACSQDSNQRPPIFEAPSERGASRDRKSVV